MHWVSKNVARVDDEYWHHYIRFAKDKPIITGKYLFFSENKDELEKIVVEEIENGEFRQAKINTEQKKKGKEHVLCLYYKDDSKKYDLAEKYKGKTNIKYRYWKSDEATTGGQYSKEFLDKLSPEERKEWIRDKNRN